MAPSDALHSLELALRLLTAVGDPFEPHADAQRALARIRVLGVEAGVRLEACRHVEELRALLRAQLAARFAQIQIKGCNGGQCAVLPLEQPNRV